MPAPTFLCIGSQKCGTTWLAHVVEGHPEVVVGREKELHFFDKQAAFARGLPWYETQFGPSPPGGPGPARAVGEFTPNYLWTVGEGPDAGHVSHWLGSAERVADAYPDVRLIVCLRDPVDRAVSGYFHAVRAGRVAPGQSLLDAARGRAGILEFGRYRRNLERWLSLFDRSQFLFLVYEADIRDDEDKARTLRRVYRHIGVDDAFESREVARVRNARETPFNMRRRHAGPLVSRAMGLVPAALREHPLWTIRVAERDLAALRALYREDVAFVNELLGHDTGWAV